MKRKYLALLAILFLVIGIGTFYLTYINSNLEENNAPIIQEYYPLNNPHINQSGVQEFRIYADDRNEDLLFYSWFVNETNVNSNSNIYFFNGTSYSNGTYIIEVIVSDGFLTDSHHWTLILNEDIFEIDYLIDHNSTHLVDLKSIPIEWINKAKRDLNIAYGHTSHGSQLTSGMENLDAFMGGNDIYLYGPEGATNDSILEFYDYYGDFGAQYTSTNANDLGNPNDDAWAEATEEYLDDHRNPGTNVIIWSWCDIGGHNITKYLNHMEELIFKYSAGGPKGRTEETEVTFIFMTGHVDGEGINGTNYLQNEIIRNHCKEKNRILYDFADIESYDPDDNSYLDLNVDDDCSYDGGNWAEEWVVGKTQMTSSSDTSHNEPNGGDWYSCDSAHSHALNANLKAYGCWYLFALLAGWNG